MKKTVLSCPTDCICRLELYMCVKYRASGRELVDPARPGDFNQALMELGARLCSIQVYKSNIVYMVLNAVIFRY
jgi:hypothetical protein